MSLPTRFTRALAAARSRYDEIALQPPGWAAGAGEAARHGDPAAWQELLRWCRPRPAAADPSRAASPWRHAAAGDFAIGVLEAPPSDAGAPAAGIERPPHPDAAAQADRERPLRRWADAFGRHLDGSTRLESLSPPAGLGWRLGILAREVLAEALPGHPRPSDDPWDVGWARVAPASIRRLERGFAPRRPTLILALGSDSRHYDMALPSLAQRRDDLRHPLRWLWVGEPVTEQSPRLAAAWRAVLAGSAFAGPSTPASPTA